MNKVFQIINRRNVNVFGRGGGGGMHFCPGTMTTHAESFNSDLQCGLDRRLRHTHNIEHRTQNANAGAQNVYAGAQNVNVGGRQSIILTLKGEDRNIQDVWESSLTVKKIQQDKDS